MYLLSFRIRFHAFSFLNSHWFRLFWKASSILKTGFTMKCRIVAWPYVHIYLTISILYRSVELKKHMFLVLVFRINCQNSHQFCFKSLVRLYMCMLKNYVLLFFAKCILNEFVPKQPGRASFTWGIQPVYDSFSWGIQPGYASFAWGKQPVYASFTWGIEPVYASFAWGKQPIYASFTWGIQPGFDSFTWGIQPVYASFTWGIQPGYDSFAWGVQQGYASFSWGINKKMFIWWNLIFALKGFYLLKKYRNFISSTRGLL